MKCERDLSKKKKKIKTMNNKMARMYVSTIESTKKLSKKNGQNQGYREHFDGCQMRQV